jgi:hypothetical protein
MKFFYRFFEILPGIAVWATLLGLVFLSWQRPKEAAVFVLLYDLYWVLKIVYLSAYLYFSFWKVKTNLKVNWLERLKKELPNWSNLYHLILLPMYREPYDLVRASFLSLLTTNYPKDKLLVVLAIEERGGSTDEGVARRIKAEFGESFGAFLIAIHPMNREGEIPGKGSNIAWAARQAQALIVNARSLPLDRVIVSVFDIDTRPARDYFALLSYRYLTEPLADRASFQPTPIFINNIQEASLFARLSSFSATFWQLIQQSRPEKLVTFSSHSMPLKALVEIGFWETDVVSEDSRIFFQCFNHYNGNWRAVPLFYPVYMDAVVGENFWLLVKNLYLQQRRWAGGVENIPRFMRDFIKNKTLGFSKKIYWFLVSFETFYSWAVGSFILLIFGWLPVILGGYEFRQLVISYNLPKFSGVILNLSLLGIMASAVVGLQIVASHLKGLRLKHYFIYFFQWLFTPLVVFIFGSLPALDAQTRLMLGGKYRLGFWRTPKKMK